MKKTITLLLLVTISIVLLKCSVTDDIKDSVDGLKCINLLQEIDEKYDREDRDCAEIRSDVDKILKTCDSFLDEEQKQQLAFYKDNCKAGD